LKSDVTAATNAAERRAMFMTIVPMLTINKLTAALEAIRTYIDCKAPTDAAKLGLIYVIANETLIETAPEIGAIKAET
jgi:hypothetical protein